jgi:hypothetical protein
VRKSIASNSTGSLVGEYRLSFAARRAARAKVRIEPSRRYKMRVAIKKRQS